MSDADGFADDDDPFDPNDPQVQRLTAMARFARRVLNVPWFERLGRELTAEESAMADEYAAALGFPHARVASVRSWLDAESLAENPQWNSDWWEAEEQLKSALITEALEVIDEAELMNALNHLTAQAAGVALEAIERAAELATYQPDGGEESFTTAIAGTAVATCFQAGLVLAAGAEEDHPFAIKFRLLEAGRLPLGIAGTTFSVF